MLGVVGDSAAGKTTLTAGLVRALGAERVSVICTDDYHRYDRAQRAERGITPLHPACNYLDILAQHLRLLCAGEPILKPVYNHRTGTFDPPVYLEPREFVIAEGLHGFSNAALRECFDIKVYLDPPEELRRRWKVQRDAGKRGYTVEQVLAELERREGDSAHFIRPQKIYADIVVRFQPPTTATDDAHLDAHLVLYGSLIHPDLNRIIACANGHPPSLQLAMGREGTRLAEFLRIAGSASEQEVLAVEQCLQEQMGLVGVPDPQSIGVFPDGVQCHHSRPLALTQLLIVYHLLRARHGATRELGTAAGPEVVVSIGEALTVR
jgi:phosphoribulokinase